MCRPTVHAQYVAYCCNHATDKLSEEDVAHPADGAKTGQDCRAEVLVRNIALQMLTGLLGIPSDLMCTTEQ